MVWKVKTEDLILEIFDTSSANFGILRCLEFILLRWGLRNGGRRTRYLIHAYLISVVVGSDKNMRSDKLSVPPTREQVQLEIYCLPARLLRPTQFFCYGQKYKNYMRYPFSCLAKSMII